MALAYDLERFRIALEIAAASAQGMLTHPLPEWFAHRLAHFRYEANSLAAATVAHEQEIIDTTTNTKGE